MVIPAYLSGWDITAAATHHITAGTTIIIIPGQGTMFTTGKGTGIAGTIAIAAIGRRVDRGTAISGQAGLDIPAGTTGITGTAASGAKRAVGITGTTEQSAHGTARRITGKSAVTDAKYGESIIEFVETGRTPRRMADADTGARRGTGTENTMPGNLTVAIDRMIKRGLRPQTAGAAGPTLIDH